MLCAQPRLSRIHLRLDPAARSLQLRHKLHVCSCQHQTHQQRHLPILASMAAPDWLQGYVKEGPLLQAAGTDVQLDVWQELGELLTSNLGLGRNLNDAQRQRIYHYYLPAYFWLEAQLEAHQAAGQAGPLIVGMSAPQGCGKTTLCEQLCALLKHRGHSGIDVSLDDFYLTFADQQALAKANAGNRLLELRSNAGTHDLALAEATLGRLRGAAAGQTVAVPRYDKSQHKGRGDRKPEGEWVPVKAPLDVVLVEGWMLGFSPVGEAQASKVHKDLPPVDARLPAYQKAIDAHVDAWLVLQVPNPACVFRWRLEAEEASKAKGKPGMTREQVADFVERYIPAYKAYLPGLYAHGPEARKAGTPVLTIHLDENRALAAQQTQPASTGKQRNSGNGASHSSRGNGGAPKQAGANNKGLQQQAASSSDRSDEEGLGGAAHSSAAALLFALVLMMTAPTTW